jgi:hypothetical protein
MADTALAPSATGSAPPDWPTYGNDAHDALGTNTSKPDVDLGVSGDVSKGLVDIQKKKMAAESGGYGSMLSDMNKDKQRVERAFNAEGVGRDELKPWNEQEESAKHNYDPIQAFGSFGSIFGILASAFTHTPAVGAMNAAAAAMGAIKEGKTADYNRAYNAWKQNTDLVVKRQKIQHEAYQDAIGLMQTNMQAGEVKMRVLAARFGDQKTLFMLEHGLSKELIDLQYDRDHKALEMKKAMDDYTVEHGKVSFLYANGYDSKNPNSPQSQEAYKKFNEMEADLKKQPSITSEEGKLIREFAGTKKPDGTLPTAEERKDFIKDLKANKTLSIDQETMARWDEDHPEATPEQRRDFAMTLPGAKGKSGADKTLTEDRQRSADVEAFRKEMAAAKNPDGSPQYTQAEIAEKAAAYAKHLKSVSAAPTGNKIDELKGLEKKVEVAEQTIDKIDKMLVQHKAMAGIGGKVTRAGEAVGNILGSNQSDRAQFRRWILELQEILPSVINGRNGRPLSAEASKIEGIVAGLAAGDTNANTLRAYDELRPLLKTLKKQLQERQGQTPGESAPAPAAPSVQPWTAYPEVK